MNQKELRRFFVVCALVSDLYCPGFNPRQSLAKDSNLARTAARYKIDPAKITPHVRGEVAKNEEKKRQAERKSEDSSQNELDSQGRVLVRGPFFRYASAEARRLRPFAIFCAMTMMSLRSGSAALLRHFRNL